MKRIGIPAFLVLLPLALAGQAFGHKRDSNHEVYKTACPSLADVTAPGALKFLNANAPTPANAVCVTWAIYVVGDEPYDAAVPTLITLLNFQRPNIQRSWNHLPGSFYPAVEALKDIGQPAASAVLAAMKDPKTSPVAESNAMEVWVAVYPRTALGDHTNAFAALRREIKAATDDNVKKQLEANIQEGLRRWCAAGKAHDDCVQAAQDGIDR